MNYAQAIEWLFSLHLFGMKLGLANIRALTESLGQPEKAFAPVLIAGTNGKGSTAAFLHQILLAAGVRSGLYTSPHLVSTEERIRIGDDPIEPETLAAILTEVRGRCESLLAERRIAAHPTFFEVITAAAFVAFERAGIEVGVLEVGLGGRLDATNIVSPILSIITGIDLDHREQLGSTLAEIAREKAGILRPDVTALLGELEEEPLAAIRESAAAAGAPIVLAGRGCRLDEAAGGAAQPSEFSLTTPVRCYPRLTCPLPGAHQRKNALLAVRAAELLDAPRRPISAEAVAAGLAATRWPGRLEWVPGNPRLLLDAAHNAGGCRVLADYLVGFEPRPVLLFAAMKDKEVEKMLAILLPRVSASVFTRLPVERAADPAMLFELAAQIAKGRSPAAGEARYRQDPDVASALAESRSLAGPEGIVLVAGSIFLVGAVKEVLLGRPVRAGAVR